MLKYLVSASVALGDTVKTSLGELQLPAGAKALLGVWGHALGGPGLTTLVNVTGILELESPDVNLQPCQVTLESVAVLTNGPAFPATKIWPLNMAVKGGERITGYITMDMAQTVANTGRFGLVVDV